MRARAPLFVSLAALVALPATARQGKAVVLPAQEQAQKQEPSAPTAPAPKRPVRAEDYGKWESLSRSSSLARDGRWLAYSINRANDKDELRLRAIGTEAEEVFEYGRSPEFSEDSRWFGYLIGVSSDEEEKLREAKKPVRTKLGLRDLVKGESEEVEDVASFSFSEDGRFVALRRFGPKDGDGEPDLVVRELASGLDTCFGNVASFAWSEAAPLVAMTIEVEGEVGNGVQVYDAASGRLRTLHSAEAKYTRLTWREDAADLACMRELSYEEDDDEDVAHAVLAWRGLDGDAPQADVYDPRKAEDVPAERRIVTAGGLRWAEDGAALFFGLQEWERKPEWARPEPEGKDTEKKDPAKKDTEKKDTDADDGKDAKKEKKDEEEPKSLRESLDEAAGVEIWHSGDVDVIPLQQKRLSGEERQNELVAWWLDAGRLVRLSAKPEEEVQLLDGERHALGLDDEPYREEQKFGPTRYDVHVIDVATGARRKALTGVKYVLDSSPDGRWFAYVAEDHVWVHDVVGGGSRNLTAGVPAKFINQEMSQLTEEKPPYGVAGWCVRSDELFLYDRYDLWMLRLDGGAPVRMTRGAESQDRYRITVLDREKAEDGIELGEPLYFSVYGDRTKKSGYSRRAGGRIERLIWKDASVGRLAKAEAADVYTFVEQRYDDSPDYFVAGADLANARKLTETNAFQSDYLWGRSELVDYTNVHGEALQGALFYPADYEPGKQYPMIVYIYELRSQVLHGYTTPTETNPYNTAVYSAEGYFVFQPDIVYRPQNPGLSAVECVEPAVKKVLESGMVDPKRVGLVGHSWGAYQTAFLVTQTDILAAGVAGAPLTNMMSMSMSMYWNSGQTDAWIFHESQGRMDRPFWRDVDTYIRNSPIFNIEKMNTPLMIAFGTDDGAVDFNQGVEMYNAARLAMKQFVMLVYPGENHGLRKKPNQVDYHYRVLEWFGHYLKGDPAPSWITEGQRWIDRQKELEEFERKNKKGKGKGGKR